MSEIALNPPAANDAQSEQPIQLRPRADLIISESEFQQEKCWIVKDPVSLKYFRIRQLEYDVMKMLDEKTSLNQICNRVNQLLGGNVDISDQQVRMLVGSLYQRGLLVGRREGYGDTLLNRFQSTRSMKRIALFTNLLSIRFPGVDPERLLNWIYPSTKWIFHPLTVFISLMVMAAAGLLALVNANELASRLPNFNQFFGPQNLILMGVVLIVSKSLHELGHALACKHYKGECHAIGLMLLVLMPVMYCNTSDSWVLKSKWKRMAIGAAGMYVEVFIASVCTLVWWYTHPGLLNNICLNVMFIGSASTVIFNANPLLRYDGYYILSDYLEIPNMGQKSRAALLSKLRATCLGLPALPRNYLPQQRQISFALYSIASFVYRWFILFVILWMLTQIFEPYGLQFVGHYMITMSLLALFGMPIFKLYKFFSNPKVREKVNPLRGLISAIALVALLLVIFLLPVPQYVSAPFVLRPVGTTVYVKNPGTLIECKVSPGQAVKKDEVLATLQNLESDTRLIQVEGQVKVLQKEVDLLSQIENFDTSQVQQLRTRSEQLETAKRQLKNEQRIFDSLQLKAPSNGIVLPPQKRAHPNPDSNQLQIWIGTPLDQDNLNAYLLRDAEFCRIAKPGRYEAILEINQHGIDLVKPDQKVRLMFDEYQGQVFKSRVSAVAPEKTTFIAEELSQSTGGSLVTTVDEEGRQTSFSSTFQATVPLESSEDEFLSGFRGNARIRVGSSPLGAQLIRYIRSVLNFS